jgi:hypothetical protein
MMKLNDKTGLLYKGNERKESEVDFLSLLFLLFKGNGRIGGVTFSKLLLLYFNLFADMI